MLPDKLWAVHECLPRRARPQSAELENDWMASLRFPPRLRPTALPPGSGPGRGTEAHQPIPFKFIFTTRSPGPLDLP